jgi:hypothetical protein
MHFDTSLLDYLKTLFQLHRLHVPSNDRIILSDKKEMILKEAILFPGQESSPVPPK